MITSISILEKAIGNYRKTHPKKEKYSAVESTIGGFGAGLATGFLAIAVVFFALELLVLFYAITVAYKCAQSGPERIVHLVLAVVFTLPYMLLNMLFNKCAVDVIRGKVVVTANDGVTEPVMGFGANRVI